MNIPCEEAFPFILKKQPIDLDRDLSPTYRKTLTLAIPFKLFEVGLSYFTIMYIPCNEAFSFNAYRISGIFRVSLIFAEFATSLKSPKMDTAKNKLYYASLLRVLEIAKIGLSENLTHLPSVIFAKISRREKFPIYGIPFQNLSFLKMLLSGGIRVSQTPMIILVMIAETQH